QAEHRRQSLQGLQVGLVHACLVAVDAGAGDEIVEAGLDAQVALRDPVGLPRLAQAAAEDRKLPFLGQARARSRGPDTKASGTARGFDTTVNVYRDWNPAERAAPPAWASTDAAVSTA